MGSTCLNGSPYIHTYTCRWLDSLIDLPAKARLCHSHPAYVSMTLLVFAVVKSETHLSIRPCGHVCFVSWYPFWGWFKGTPKKEPSFWARSKSQFPFKYQRIRSSFWEPASNETFRFYERWTPALTWWAKMPRSRQRLFASNGLGFSGMAKRSETGATLIVVSIWCRTARVPNEPHHFPEPFQDTPRGG